MIVRKLRLEKGWSQEHLAELCNLSVRTIQRIERGQKPSLETLKALAAVFEIDVSDLSMEADMTEKATKATISTDEEKVIMYVRDIKGFYSHLIKYAIAMFVLFIINTINSPDYYWVIWPAIGWGIGVLFHGLNVFEIFSFFGPEWEKRQIEKRLNKG